MFVFTVWNLVRNVGTSAFFKIYSCLHQRLQFCPVLLPRKPLHCRSTQALRKRRTGPVLRSVLERCWNHQIITVCYGFFALCEPYWMVLGNICVYKGPWLHMSVIICKHYLLILLPELPLTGWVSVCVEETPEIYKCDLSTDSVGAVTLSYSLTQTVIKKLQLDSVTTPLNEWWM